MSKQTVLYEVFESVNDCANFLKGLVKSNSSVYSFQIVTTKQGDYGIVVILNGPKGDK